MTQLFEKQAAFTKKATDLPDVPSPTLTPAEIKEYFQTSADELLASFNNLVDGLNQPKVWTEDKLADGAVSRRTIQPGAVGLKELDPAIANEPTTPVGVQAKLAEHDEQLVDIAINIESFGAKPNDPTFDNVSAIQSAIDHAYSLGGGTVLIPKGTFWLKSVNGIYSIMIRPRPNVNLVGQGNQSILKVVDGLNTNGTFNVIRHGADDTYSTVDNVMFKDFVIDCNGGNNLVPQGQPNKDNVAIGIWKGSNILIENVTVMDSAGRQCFSFGSNLSPHTIENIVIRNNRFINNITDLNVYQTDHSTIYCQANKAIIQGNLFQNKTNYFTAIENHSSNSIVDGNIIIKANVAMNVVAQVTNQQDSLYINNIIKNVNQAFVFWLYTNFIMDKVTIKNNTITVNENTDWTFNMTSQVQIPINNIRIEDNVIEYVGNVLTRTKSCIALGRFNQCSIKNNTFKNFPSRAIDVQTIAVDCEIMIEGNSFIDCCRGQIANYTQALAFYTSVKIKSLFLKNNYLENTNVQFITKGIDGNTNVDYLDICHNRMINLPSKGHILWSNTASFVNILVDHFGVGHPEGVIPASLNSVYVDLATNIIYRKKTSDKTNGGWKAEMYGTQSPTTGTFYAGDRVINTSPTAGGYEGWICTLAGSPGTWKGYGLIQA